MRQLSGAGFDFGNAGQVCWDSRLSPWQDFYRRVGGASNGPAHWSGGGEEKKESAGQSPLPSLGRNDLPVTSVSFRQPNRQSRIEALNPSESPSVCVSVLMCDSVWWYRIATPWQCTGHNSRPAVRRPRQAGTITSTRPSTATLSPSTWAACRTVWVLGWASVLSTTTISGTTRTGPSTATTLTTGRPARLPQSTSAVRCSRRTTRPTSSACTPRRRPLRPLPPPPRLRAPAARRRSCRRRRWRCPARRCPRRRGRPGRTRRPPRSPRPTQLGAATPTGATGLPRRRGPRRCAHPMIGWRSRAIITILIQVITFHSFRIREGFAFCGRTPQTNNSSQTWATQYTRFFIPTKSFIKIGITKIFSYNNKMFSSVNKTFGCCSKIFGCSNKKKYLSLILLP